MGCPRRFTDVSIKLEWESICTEETGGRTTIPGGGASAESTEGSTQATSRATSGLGDASVSETASAGAEATGGESDGSGGAPMRGASSIWLSFLPLALACL